MFNDSIIRKLARSHYYQTLYARAKELTNIELFENKINFSKIQVYFLQLLELYNNLYIDIAVGEEHINEERLENDIDVRAYLVYKEKNKEKERYKRKTNKRIGNKRVTDSIVFRGKGKK